jgi:uncharacterized protein
VIVPDVNLLIYAYSATVPQHQAAKRWWEQLLSSDQRVGIPWIVIVGFIRITTTRTAMLNPVTPADALARVKDWFTMPLVFHLNPGPRHLEIMAETLRHTAGGPLTTDAHIAALAIEHQAEVHSNDLDFARFSGLRWFNPLAVET